MNSNRNTRITLFLKILVVNSIGKPVKFAVLMMFICLLYNIVELLLLFC